MKVRAAKWLLLAVGVAIGACETASPMIIAKNGQGNDLRISRIDGMPLPSGCPKITESLPTGKTSIAVSYSEPTNRQDGLALYDLDYTTVYVSSPNVATIAIRVWSNDARGGAHVTIREIPVVGPEVGICVTATDSRGNESAP